MPILAIVFDLGGVLELIPEGGDPTERFPALFAAWDRRLGWQSGAMAACLDAVAARLAAAGKNGALGTCTEDEWMAELRAATGLDADQMQAFLRDFWDIYVGEINVELRAYFAALRPRYRTAFLSNSFVGARASEQERLTVEDISDLIVYSHEVGVAKPDPRIFALTCQRLGVAPTEVIFVDDNEANIAAARAYGIHAIRFTDNAHVIAAIEACIEANGMGDEARPAISRT